MSKGIAGVFPFEFGNYPLPEALSYDSIQR
jgi:hypothetical protein